MRCLYCNRPVPVIRRLQRVRYCSDEHHRLYIDAHTKNALDVLTKSGGPHTVPAPGATLEGSAWHGDELSEIFPAGDFLLNFAQKSEAPAWPAAEPLPEAPVADWEVRLPAPSPGIFPDWRYWTPRGSRTPTAPGDVYGTSGLGSGVPGRSPIGQSDPEAEFSSGFCAPGSPSPTYLQNGPHEIRTPSAASVLGAWSTLVVAKAGFQRQEQRTVNYEIPRQPLSPRFQMMTASVVRRPHPPPWTRPVNGSLPACGTTAMRIAIGGRTDSLHGDTQGFAAPVARATSLATNLGPKPPSFPASASLCESSLPLASMYPSAELWPNALRRSAGSPTPHLSLMGCPGTGLPAAGRTSLASFHLASACWMSCQSAPVPAIPRIDAGSAAAFMNLAHAAVTPEGFVTAPSRPLLGQATVPCAPARLRIEAPARRPVPPSPLPSHTSEVCLPKTTTAPMRLAGWPAAGPDRGWLKTLAGSPLPPVCGEAVGQARPAPFRVRVPGGSECPGRQRLLVKPPAAIWPAWSSSISHLPAPHNPEFLATGLAVTPLALVLCE